MKKLDIMFFIAPISVKLFNTYFLFNSVLFQILYTTTMAPVSKIGAKGAIAKEEQTWDILVC